MHVSTQAVGHRFGEGPWLFTGLDLHLVPRHTYALTGPSGSGKSTLLAILAGWMAPAAGTIERVGVHRIAWVFQNAHGAARRTALDHVTLPFVAAGLGRDEAERRAGVLLERLGLAEAAGRRFSALSGGEAQRLMLARAMAGRPALLLVDEPTAQLDQHTAASVSAAIGALADEATILVVATHDARTRDACSDVVDLGASDA